MIESELISNEVGGKDAIDGVLVTTPIPDGRVKLGAQVWDAPGAARVEQLRALRE